MLSPMRLRVRQRVGGGWSLAPHADVGARRIVRVNGHLQEALNAGDNVRVLTVTSKLSEPTHVRVDWVCVVSFTRSCDARCRGVRVGEARNPGPPGASAAGSSMETTRSSPNRFPTSPPMQGRVWQECCTPFDSTQVDSVPDLADTPVFSF